MAANYGMLFAELGTFLSVQLLALFVGLKMITTLAGTKFAGVVAGQHIESLKKLGLMLPPGQSFLSFIIAFAIATTALILVLKFLKKPIVFKGFFAFLIFFGSEIVFEAFVPTIFAIGLALVVVGLRYFIPNVLTHNLGFFLAIAGVSAQLGLTIPVLAVVGLLIILSVYDYIAVFKTKHMVAMFRGMMAQGAVMGAIIPRSPELLLYHSDQAVASKLRHRHTDGEPAFMMLGGGDLAFPAVFMISALAQYGIVQAFGVLLGSLAGIVVIHYLFTVKKFKALPALPPLAVGGIVGFGISLLPQFL
jgi:presenilin-like A22 family membrane protease